ncbi:MAG: hypoxanthine phosphoribosyltransferase, partial [Candidatus Eremiobacteraeota bacterium]|nr:hypoxanthine phosphoribosyltransferase [Candidatus Eremiobacteraeota bacterium]
MIYSPQQIDEAVGGLARQIGADYRGKPLVLLGVLKGALYFTVDLARALAGVAD